MTSGSVREEQHLPGLTASTAISLSLASLIHVLVLLRGFYSATLDESGRTLDAYNWVHGGEPLATVWLPFYKIVVGAALLVFPDLVITPRVVSFAFGMLALWAVIWFAQILFHDRTTTLLTGFLAVVFPPRVVLTVAPLAEIMFIFVMTLATGLLARWFSTGKSAHLWRVSILFAIGSSIRYEGWIFAGLFAVYVVLFLPGSLDAKVVSRSVAAGVALVAVSFVAFWVLLHIVQTGRALGFVGDTAGRYARIHGDSLSFLLLNNPLSQFALQNIWTLNVLGVLSFAPWLRRNPSRRVVTLLPVVALLLVSMIALWGNGMPTHGFWRIPTLWSVLLIPFTANWFVVRLNSPPGQATLQRIVSLGVLACMVVLCLRGIFTMTEHSALSRDDLAAGRFVSSRLIAQPDSHMVLIESDIWSYVNVMIASQHPERFIFNSGFDPVAHGEPILDPEAPFDGARLRQMGIALLVFRREDYKDYLEGKGDVKKLEEVGPWTIYSLASARTP